GHIIRSLEEAFERNGRATIALSGGSAPKLLFPHVAAAHLDWRKVDIFWVDERNVPPDSEQSNFRMASEYLLWPAAVPEKNIHRIRAELGAEVAAARYAEEIRSLFSLDERSLPQLDIMQLGLGDDAHTASLFPGEPRIEDREGVAAACYVEKFSQWRITLLPGVLLQARDAVYFVSGEGKAEALRSVLRDEYDPLKYPAQVVARNRSRLSWYVDQAAARLLQ
ncbi:MAG: 6-phosphogluconolactonase, partial [Bryobacteraceae bacterium]